MISRLITATFFVVCTSAVLANEPATQPAEAEQTQPQVIVTPQVDGVIQLPDGTTINLGDGGVMTRIAVVRGMGADGMTTQVTDERGRQIEIHETDDGKIEITISEQGKDPVKVSAANAEELEQNHPDEFELYQRHSHPPMMVAFRDGAGAMGGREFDGRMVLRGAGPGMGRGMGMGGVPIDALGATGAAVRDPFVRAQLGEGVIISRIDPESFAETLGLKPFDLIKSVNGQPVRTPEELDDALVSADQVEVEIVRAGKPITLEEK